MHQPQVAQVNVEGQLTQPVEVVFEGGGGALVAGEGGLAAAKNPALEGGGLVFPVIKVSRISCSWLPRTQPAA